MKKLIAILFCLVLCFGCASSKKVTWDLLGKKTITTETDASKLYDARLKALEAYYKRPSETLATIMQNGVTITLYNQVAAPLPDIQQHKNQMADGIFRIVDKGLSVTGNVGLAYMAKEALSDLKGTTVNNGSGQVTIDESRPLEVNTAGASIEKGNDKADNHVDSSINNADPLVVTTDKLQVVETEKVYEVRPEVVIVPPTIVNPIVVQPEIVNPVTVNPVVVNPVIVQQPALTTGI